MLVLNKLTDLLRRTEGVGEFFFGVPDRGPQLVSPTRTYTNLLPLACGDLADVFSAEADKQRYVLKICRDNACNSLLVAEQRMLQMLAQRSGKTQYRQYNPSPVESFVATGELAGRQVNVFTYRDGFHTLESIRAAVPAGLDARHLGWLFKRMLVAMGFAHRCGLVHGAILPPHLLVQPEDHSLQLVDWIGAVKLGQRLSFIPEAYSEWYPREVLHKKPATAATDLFLAAKSLVYAAGGNPVTGHWPDAVPRQMRQFVDTCLFPAPRRRPQDAWRLHEEFDELLCRLFGPPEYHPLVIE
jgi:hypothetical protein